MNAQTCCSGGIPLSNNIGLPISEKGTLQLGLNYDYNNLNTLNSGTETLNDNTRLRITHSILFNTSYAITNRFSVEGLFTWVNQRRIITSTFDGSKNLEASSGVGDAIILLKYNFPDLISKNSDLIFGLGSKIPIGSSSEVDSRGILLINDLQPGSNAWDIIYWLSASKRFDFRPSLSVSTRFVYRSTGIDNDYLGNSTYKYGNEFQGFLSFSDQFTFLKTLASPSISFKYRNTVKDETGGGKLDNTGGNWVFIIPNFSINITPSISFSTKAELPIYSNVDGTQLTPTYRITTGVLIKINPKKMFYN
ncbi:hypothetical protein Q4Q34_09480 [Flavivirga abyssicola]|uniref:hypothetical protein n=1 Tax=Flavivirga abyssicola TaxID=3063533 RepID=UPI0026E06EB4|nr:hypothetical protein [Flavivirga sp. MEBiC07777]WVK15257.1 hypothetical protein Q4Q34_09480 [Flavivirga sp. MEBiC07777]